jgi:hypothetical protein
MARGGVHGDDGIVGEIAEAHAVQIGAMRSDFNRKRIVASR